MSTNTKDSPKPWSRSDIQQAYREGRYEAILEAKKAGLLDNLSSAPANTRSVKLGDQF